MTEALTRLSTVLTTAPPAEESATLISGVVVEITGSVARVTAGARDLSARFLNGASGRIGDTVWMLSQGNTNLIIGGEGNGEKVGARMWRAGVAFGLAAATMTPIPFDTVVDDANDFWSAGAPTRLTVPAGLGGRYLALGRITYSCGGTMTGLGTFVRLNGTTIIARYFNNMSGISGFTTYEAAQPYDLNPGDYVEVCGYVTTATSAVATIDTGANTTDPITPTLDLWAL